MKAKKISISADLFKTAPLIEERCSYERLAEIIVIGNQGRKFPVRSTLS